MRFEFGLGFWERARQHCAKRRSRLRERKLVRGRTVKHVPCLVRRGATLGLLFGLFSSIPLGCSGQDQYTCGVKNSLGQCWSFARQADCQAQPICVWRIGCTSGCLHATSAGECSSQHLGCSFGAEPGTCPSNRCQEEETEQLCSGLEDCHWEASCWDAPNTECSHALSETECKRRNCHWTLPTGV